jgi:hypothetical protein
MLIKHSDRFTSTIGSDVLCSATLIDRQFPRTLYRINVKEFAS